MQFWREVGYLFVRGWKQGLRPLPALIPSLFLPAFFLVVFSAAFAKIGTTLPGFGASDYLVFYAPVAILQAIFFSSGDAGIDLVVDITSGYFDKLMVAPIRPLAIILGKLLSVGLRATIQAAIVIGFILLLGGKIVTGVPGFFLILLLGALFGMGWSGIGMTIALLTKNQRATQSAFILFFPFTFITTAQLPLNLLSGWYKTAVLINPVTYVLEAFRALTTTGWQALPTVGVGFLAAAGVALVTLSATLWAFGRVTK